MKNFRLIVLSFALAFFLSTPSTSIAQGNPLKHIPITDQTALFQNATFTIDDFFVKDNSIYVSSTLRGSIGGNVVVVPDVASPVNIVNTTCNILTLQIGAVPVSISNQSIEIGNFSVIATVKSSNDNRLKNALCGIADATGSNASLNAIVAKLKAAIRAY